MNRCKTIRNLLALRPADLSFAEQQQVKMHLVACAECTALAQVYAGQDGLIRNGPRVMLTPSQRGHLLSQIQRERRRYTMMSKSALILSTVTAIVLFVAIGLGVGALVTNQATPEALPARLVVEAEISSTPEVTLSLVWPVEGHHIGQGYSETHPALDIAAEEGTTVVAVADGVVIFVGWDELHGHNILIDHGHGWRSFYSKLLDYQVAVGDEVTTGQPIGRVGSTGQSTGPHLHFELRQNVDPWPLLPRAIASYYVKLF